MIVLELRELENLSPRFHLQKMFISIEGPLVYSDASNTKRLKLDQGLAPHGHFQLPDPGPLTQASELKAGADHIYSAVSYIKGNDVLERTR